MECPRCRRHHEAFPSRARGSLEGLLLQLGLAQPYRCRHCGWRGRRMPRGGLVVVLAVLLLVLLLVVLLSHTESPTAEAPARASAPWPARSSPPPEGPALPHSL